MTSVSTAVNPVLFALASAPDTKPADADLLLAPAESRTQHASRVNRQIAVISSLILGFFVVCRVFLLWQISHNRKKLVQVNSPEIKP